MTTLTLEISDESFKRLESLSKSRGKSVEELAGELLEEWLTDPHTEFRQIADRVLTKNAELYRRLATK